MADFKELNSLLGEYAVPEKTENGDSGSDLHSLLGEYGDENTKNLSAPKSRKSLATDIVQDVGIGTLELPGAVTGLADIPAGLMGFDRPFSKGAEKLGEVTGFQPGKWAEEAEKTAYSPERVAAEQRVSQAWEDYDTGKGGILGAIGKTLAEPRVLAGTVLKSAPSMAAGMGLAKGAKALAPALSPVIAGAAGEGAVMAGQQMEQIDEAVDPQRAALASTLTGVGGAALGYAGGKIADKLGLTDLETLAAGGEAAQAGAKALPIYKRVPAGAIQEGLLEEAPQSALEQASQNIAEGKDVTEGMARAVTQGALAGGVMGAGTNILPSGEAIAPPVETAEPDFAEVPDTQPQEPIIAGAPSDLDLRTDAEKAAARQDRFNDLSARFYGTSDVDTVIDGKPVTIPGRQKEFLSPEEKAELSELEKEFGAPIDLSTPAAAAPAAAVDIKDTEDFLNRFENAWATTGREPTRVTSALAKEAAKLGVPVTPNDAPSAVIAAMRAEIQARKTPEEVAQDVGDAIVAETLAAYPDGKPGIAGKTVIAGAGSKVLEPQKLAIEQKLAEQQPVVEEQVTELPEFEPEIPWEEYDDSIPGFEEPAPVVPLTAEELQKQRMLREAAIAEQLHPEEDEDEDSERQAALQARYEANKAKQEAQDALKQQETGEVYGSGSQQPGLRGEGERPAISGEGISPEGQAVGDIPTTEKVETQPTDIGEENGESEDQAETPTAQEVTPEYALREIGRLSDEAMGGNHPAMPQQSLANGDFAGSGKLNMDDGGNVVLTRVASSEDHLSKNWQDISGKELIDTSLSHGGGRGLPTSGIASWGKSYGATHGGDRVIGTFKIPLQDLLSAIQNGNAILGNIGEGEIVLNPAFAESYLDSVTDTEGNPVTRKQDGISLPTDITGRTEAITEAPEEKARKLLVSAAPSGDLSAFRGKQNTDNRVKLIEALTGQKIAKNQATNARLIQEFYKAAGVDLNQSLAAQQKQFEAWATQAQELQEAGITEDHPIDLQAAKEAAASRFNGHREVPEDRDAQKKAYVSVKGVNIGIENPAGTKRRPEWPELKDHYGFIVGVKGADGDYMDVFIQPGMTQADIDTIDTVYVVDQKNEDGSFDEHKVIIGPKTVEDAAKLYLRNYEPGWQGLGAITEMGFDEFKEGVESYDPRLNAMDEPIAYEPPVVETPAEQAEEPTEGQIPETAEEQVPETELAVKPEPTKGKPVADDFLKLMADFNRQQEKKYRLVDSDVKPTIGKGGRLHAPHNGYEWIDGNVYAGGQWLAESEDSIRGSKPSKVTIETTPEVAAYIEEQAKDLAQIRVSLGKIYEKNGENRRLVYVEGGRALTRAIADLAPSRDRVLMSAADAEEKGISLGKTWKYSYKRHFNEEMKYGTYLGSDESLDKQIVGYYYPDAVIRDLSSAEAKTEAPVAETEKPIKAAKPEYETAGGKNLTKAQARDQLVAAIDEAIKAAPKEQTVFAQDTDEIQQRLAEYKTYGTTEQRKHELTKEIHDLYSAQLDQITFKIPGGTRYKVLNTKPALEEFKKKILASPGFKESRGTTSKPKAPPFSVSSMIAEFLKDNEYENAYYAAQEAGVRLGFGTSEKENTIPVYTDVEPVSLIPDRATFVGRRFAKIEYKGNTEVKTYWHVIDEASGASLSSGSNKKEAIAAAEKAIKERDTVDGGKRLAELLEQAEARGANQEQLLDRFKKLHGIEAEQAEEKELPSKEELMPAAPIEQPENKDLAVVKAKFADSVQKAYEEGELEIPQYMVALDILASDDPTVLQDIQRFVDKAFPSYGELQRVKAKGSVNMKRLLSLVGSSMYKANLADTSIKEMVQNSFDAVKAQVSKNKGLRGKGNIDILVDHSNRLIAIRDNGKGMSKNTILNAFLTVAGSNKEDLEGGLASGGFGMAKAAFLYGNERIYLRTVHNGKLSILEASGDELLSEKGGAEIEITDTDEPNGTTLIVKVPENVNIDGESRYVYFPYGYEGIDFLRKPLLNDDVAINYRDGYIDPKAFMDPTPSAGEDFDSSMIGANVVPTGRNMDLSGYDKNTTANFDWGSADIYIGKKRNKYPKHQILSAGVYQFDDSFNLRGWEKVPYDLIINVKPTVDADSASYPFNLKREGWKDLVEKDIDALKQYVKQVAMGIEAQETVDVFKNIKSLPKIEVANIGKSTGFDVSDFIPKKEIPTEVAGATAFVPPSVTVSVGKVTGVDAKGETVTYVDVEKEKQKEKGGESSFSTEKEAPKASDFLADFGIDASAPVYVNNTSYDYVETDPNIAVFFAELGNIMMQVKAKVMGMDMYGYKKLKDTDTFMGISIDKQYHGVHVNVPFHGIFLNPLAVKGTKLPGITQGLWETIVHEFTHIPEGNHDVGFVTEYHELSAKLASDGFDIQMRVLLGRVLNKHKASFLAAREQYESSTTKNIAKSLHEGEDGTGVASVTAQARPERGAGKPTADTDADVQRGREAAGRARFSRNAELRGAGATDLAPLFESLGRVNKLSQLSDDQLQRIDEHPDAERIRYVQDNFLDLLSELDARPNSEFEIKC